MYFSMIYIEIAHIKMECATIPTSKQKKEMQFISFS